MNNDFLRREWGAVAFVIITALGLVIVPVALSLNKQNTGGIASPAAVVSPSPLASPVPTVSGSPAGSPAPAPSESPSPSPTPVPSPSAT